MDMGVSALLMLVVGSSIAAKVVWELYLSPLARQRIPGPKWAAISDFSHNWLQLRRCRVWAYHDLFEVHLFPASDTMMRRSLTRDASTTVQRYGPVVRIGPNRVIFRNMDVVKTIYSTHNFRKSNWYDVFTFGGSKNIFSTQ